MASPPPSGRKPLLFSIRARSFELVGARDFAPPVAPDLRPEAAARDGPFARQGDPRVQGVDHGDGQGRRRGRARRRAAAARGAAGGDDRHAQPPQDDYLSYGAARLAAAPRARRRGHPRRAPRRASHSPDHQPRRAGRGVRGHLPIPRAPRGVAQGAASRRQAAGDARRHGALHDLDQGQLLRRDRGRAPDPALPALELPRAGDRREHAARGLYLRGACNGALRRRSCLRLPGRPPAGADLPDAVRRRPLRRPDPRELLLRLRLARAARNGAPLRAFDLALGADGAPLGARGARVGQPLRTFPKIELHVHLEGTVRPATLLEIARRNDYALPADTEDGVAALYEFRDFAHFIEVWVLTTNALQQAEDFRQVLVDYAAEAAAHGAVYLEGIFSPAERARRGVRWKDMFEGYCDGAAEARELHGVEVRLTPDITRGFTDEEADETVRWASRYRDRGVVGVGLGGLESEYPPEPYAPVFERARGEGLASVPHAGEVAGPASVRGALDALGAVRVRHGIRAVEDASLVDELRDRALVLDVCPISNVRTGAVSSLEAHPLRELVTAGVHCSVSTDDPAMFDTDLTRDYEAAASLGLSPRAAYEAGVRGALCDGATRARLREIGEDFDWNEAS